TQNIVIPDPPQYETPFADIPATSNIIMYEINERAFSSPGTFAGILPRLDSIKDLGVNVIWLMPIHPIGVIKSINSPYCVKNYREVNSEYGNLEDLRTLVREAHKRKMGVILDWVANHTSWDNAWIQNKSWYTHDGQGNIISPPGTTWTDVADLNYDNSDMRLEMIRCMKYWLLTANVDGFRCDAADYVPFSFWRQAIDSIKKIPNRKLILLAEGARSDHFTAGFQMNFGWDFFNTNKNVFRNNQSASVYYLTNQSEYSNIPAGSQKLRFTSNHDEDAWDDTPLGLFGGKTASMSAFIISAYLGGVPLIYNGQEVGCPVKLPMFSRSPINWTTNPDMVKEYKWLMQLRTSHAALRTGDLECYPDSNVVAVERQVSGDELLFFVNTRNTSTSFTLPGNIKNTTWQNASDGATVVLDSLVNLNAYEYLILVK
ncbi:MAG: alpha-amylase family glycosyl hydrolase, partial [Bacteroidales bacterium]